MSNTIDLSITLAAQEVMPSLVTALAPITAFSTDYSPELASNGAAVDVSLVSAQTADTDTADYEDTTGGTLSKITVTLNQYAKRTNYLDDISENKITSIDFWSAMLTEAYYAVGKAVLQNVMGLVTEANFGAASFVGGADTFDFDSVVDLRTACTLAGIPKEKRSLILPSDYTGALIKDTKISDVSASGSSEPKNMGEIGGIAGFKIIECDNIPTNSENLKGIASHPSAIAVAMRPPRPQMGYAQAGTNWKVITHPETGISLGLRYHYSNATGYLFYTVETYYGRTVTGLQSLKRLTNAELV